MQSQFNRANVDIVLSLAINMIANSILKVENLTIFTFYCVQ